MNKPCHHFALLMVLLFLVPTLISCNEEDLVPETYEMAPPSTWASERLQQKMSDTTDLWIVKALNEEAEKGKETPKLRDEISPSQKLNGKHTHVKPQAPADTAPLIEVAARHLTAPSPFQTAATTAAVAAAKRAIQIAQTGGSGGIVKKHSAAHSSHSGEIRHVAITAAQAVINKHKQRIQMKLRGVVHHATHRHATRHRLHHHFYHHAKWGYHHKRRHHHTWYHHGGHSLRVALPSAAHSSPSSRIKRLQHVATVAAQAVAKKHNQRIEKKLRGIVQHATHRHATRHRPHHHFYHHAKWGYHHKRRHHHTWYHHGGHSLRVALPSAAHSSPSSRIKRLQHVATVAAQAVAKKHNQRIEKKLRGIVQHATHRQATRHRLHHHFYHHAKGGHHHHLYHHGGHHHRKHHRKHHIELRIRGVVRHLSRDTSLLSESAAGLKLSSAQKKATLHVAMKAAKAVVKRHREEVKKWLHRLVKHSLALQHQHYDHHRDPLREANKAAKTIVMRQGRYGKKKSLAELLNSNRHHRVVHDKEKAVKRGRMQAKREAQKLHRKMLMMVKKSLEGWQKGDEGEQPDTALLSASMSAYDSSVTKPSLARWLEGTSEATRRLAIKVAHDVATEERDHLRHALQHRRKASTSRHVEHIAGALSSSQVQATKHLATMVARGILQKRNKKEKEKEKEKGKEISKDAARKALLKMQTRKNAARRIFKRVIKETKKEVEKMKEQRKEERHVKDREKKEVIMVKRKLRTAKKETRQRLKEDIKKGVEKVKEQRKEERHVKDRDKKEVILVKRKLRTAKKEARQRMKEDILRAQKREHDSELKGKLQRRDKRHKKHEKREEKKVEKKKRRKKIEIREVKKEAKKVQKQVKARVRDIMQKLKVEKKEARKEKAKISEQKEASRVAKREVPLEEKKMKKIVKQRLKKVLKSAKKKFRKRVMLEKENAREELQEERKKAAEKNEKKIHTEKKNAKQKLATDMKKAGEKNEKKIHMEKKNAKQKLATDMKKAGEKNEKKIHMEKKQVRQKLQTAMKNTEEKNEKKIHKEKKHAWKKLRGAMKNTEERDEKKIHKEKKHAKQKLLNEMKKVHKVMKKLREKQKRSKQKDNHELAKKADKRHSQVSKESRKRQKEQEQEEQRGERMLVPKGQSNMYA